MLVWLSKRKFEESSCADISLSKGCPSCGNAVWVVDKLDDFPLFTNTLLSKTVETIVGPRCCEFIFNVHHPEETRVAIIAQVNVAAMHTFITS